MWVLVVLSTMYGSDEVKTTHYDLYQSEKSCMIATKKLYKEFTQNERAICMEIPSKKPRDLRKK